MAGKKQSKIDGFVSGIGKIFSIGEEPDDRVVRALRRFLSWCKYIAGIELMAAVIGGLPAYGVYKIRRGEVDGFIETVVQVADVMFEERECEPQKNVCPECGCDDTEIWDTTQDVWKWKCKQCGAVFAVD